MKKNTLARLAVQTVGACFGVLGLVWLYLGCHFAVTGIRDSNLFQVLYMTPMFFVLGGIVITVAWQSIRHFGPKAIQSVAALVAFALYTGMFMLLRPIQAATWESEKRLHHAATFLVPMLLAILLYRVLSRKLIEIADPDSTQQDAAPRP